MANRRRKSGNWRVDAFKLWCWGRLSRDRKETNQSILNEINPEYSLEGLMLRLKCQYSGHLMWRANSLEKTLLLGKIEGKRRKGWQRMRWSDSITDSVDMNLSKLGEIVKDRGGWYATVHGVAKHGAWFRDWTTKKHLTLLFVPLNKILLGPEVHIFICLISFRLSVEKEFFSDTFKFDLFISKIIY